MRIFYLSHGFVVSEPRVRRDSRFRPRYGFLFNKYICISDGTPPHGEWFLIRGGNTRFVVFFFFCVQYNTRELGRKQEITK